MLGRAGDRVVMRTPRGALWAEPNPIPEGEPRTLRLPEIDLPADAHTIAEGAPTFVSHAPFEEG